MSSLALWIIVLMMSRFTSTIRCFLITKNDQEIGVFASTVWNIFSQIGGAAWQTRSRGNFECSCDQETIAFGTWCEPQRDRCSNSWVYWVLTITLSPFHPPSWVVESPSVVNTRNLSFLSGVLTYLPKTSYRGTCLLTLAREVCTRVVSSPNGLMNGTIFLTVASL